MDGVLLRERPREVLQLLVDVSGADAAVLRLREGEHVHSRAALGLGGGGRTLMDPRYATFIWISFGLRMLQ